MPPCGTLLLKDIQIKKKDSDKSLSLFLPFMFEFVLIHFAVFCRER